MLLASKNIYWVNKNERRIEVYLERQKAALVPKSFPGPWGHAVLDCQPLDPIIGLCALTINPSPETAQMAPWDQRVLARAVLLMRYPGREK